MFLGIRGRIQKKSPIRIGTAYFSDNAFLNKLGLNPVFTLIRSYLDSTDSDNDLVHFMGKDEAFSNVQSYLNNKGTDYVESPIARDVTYDTVVSIKPNIVLIIMESMSVAKMTRHGNKNNITPFLDSLSHSSIYFENMYSAGKHTFNGIFSSLFSFPALYRQHTMKNIREYTGLSKTLKDKGYSTTYFTTHDSQYDNIEGFLRTNNFQHIISQADYPISEVKTTLGVPDDYMFRYSMPIINDLAKEDNPFFVTFMTTSDHGPFYVPDYFKPKTDEIGKQIVEYADWSLKSFIQSASKQKWFNNTLFVFVADHGVPMSATYDISLNYFHIPLLFYSPNLIKSPKSYKKMGNQVDIFPTIMGLIKQPYINNTLGIDLINENREFAIINDDDKIGILDTTHFCIMKEKTMALYNYREKDRTDYFIQNKDKANKMAKYARSNMQVHQEMILSGQTKLPNN
ncbi:LTA synthase family protein [Psychroserpens sp.]|uniref:LTA synthase family protein n=1 Tax=Psychroserpens sp. TaxID=2020870 RepID=UPI003859E730